MSTTFTPPHENLFARLLRTAVGAKPGEGAVLLWSSAFYFCVLCAYYVIRPIRDDIGAASGAEKLAWLFTGTMLAMLAVHPLYTACVSKLTRGRFIALAYRFFIVNLVLFFVVFRLVDPAKSLWASWVFFIWTSVFNLFVVSVFWSLLTDVFGPGQGKRLFGVIAVGGTLGAMFGSAITTTLVGVLGRLNLLLVSAVILELAVQASRVLDRAESALRSAEAREAPSNTPITAPDNTHSVIGGGVFDGIKHIASSPYLLGIASLILFYTISSTFLYFQQVDIVARVFGDDRDARTRVFGAMDLIINVLTLVAQLFLTGRVLKWLGVAFALAILPLITLVGFAALGIAPVLAVFVVVNTVRRAGNFAFQRPVREALFTVLPRTDKYKAKHFTDTFVYRFGDQVGAWANPALTALGFGASGLAFSMVPIAAAWLMLSLWLGRKYRVLEGSQALHTGS